MWQSHGGPGRSAATMWWWWLCQSNDRHQHSGPHLVSVSPGERRVPLCPQMHRRWDGREGAQADGKTERAARERWRVWWRGQSHAPSPPASRWTAAAAAVRRAGACSALLPATPRGVRVGIGGLARVACWGGARPWRWGEISWAFLGGLDTLTMEVWW
ncbi:hypothetical protein EDC01DRAFT_315253 [Geopyxis carbonaria]|nr:hypothetical protein EDC01DRAFT_315253 [Geopyxis carbonaria]